MGGWALWPEPFDDLGRVDHADAAGLWDIVDPSTSCDASVAAARQMAAVTCISMLRAQGASAPAGWPDGNPEYQPAEVLLEVRRLLSADWRGATAWVECEEFPCLLALRDPISGSLPAAAFSISKLRLVLDDAQPDRVELAYFLAYPEGGLGEDLTIQEDIADRFSVRVDSIRRSIQDQTIEPLEAR
jgi:hypothetical protein